MSADEVTITLTKEQAYSLTWLRSAFKGYGHVAPEDVKNALPALDVIADETTNQIGRIHE